MTAPAGFSLLRICGKAIPASGESLPGDVQMIIRLHTAAEANFDTSGKTIKND
jgi:hypothetical protein